MLSVSHLSITANMLSVSQQTCSRHHSMSLSKQLTMLWLLCSVARASEWHLSAHVAAVNTHNSVLLPMRANCALSPRGSSVPSVPCIVCWLGEMLRLVVLRWRHVHMTRHHLRPRMLPFGSCSSIFTHLRQIKVAREQRQTRSQNTTEWATRV